MDSEPNFEVTDKRRFHVDDDTVADAVPDLPSADEDAAADAMPPMDVYDLLRTTVSLLANGAWGWMGLTTNPFSGKMERDLEQARVAIDTIRGLTAQLEPRLSDEERREVQTLLANLQVNFVQQSQRDTQ